MTYRERACNLVILIAAAALPASAQPFTDGEILTGLPAGEVARFDPSGDRLGALRVPSGGQITGMCFDKENRLYVTDFMGKTVARYNAKGELLEERWADGFDGNPESCVVDKDGRVYVGTVEPSRGVYRFEPDATLDRIFKPRPAGSRGMDWIDLAADQCTLFYTSEGPEIGRYDVCRDQQLETFARLAGECFALRIRPRGEVMVACSQTVYRLDRDGQVLQRYEVPGEKLFALNLDPDGRTFWTGGIRSANVYRVDIDSGRGVDSPHFNAAGIEQPKPGRREPRREPQNLFDLLTDVGQAFRDTFNNFAAGERMGGLTIYGEVLAALPKRNDTPAAVAPRKPETTQPEPDIEGVGPESSRPEPAPNFESRMTVDPLPGPQSQDPSAALAEVEPKFQPPAPKSIPPTPPMPDGVLDLGSAEPIRMTTAKAGQTVSTVLRLDGLRVRGQGTIRLSTDFVADRARLELRHDGEWKPLGVDHLELKIGSTSEPSWDLRLVVGSCPPATEGPFKLRIETEPVMGGGSADLSVPLDLRIEAEPWIQCWWPVLAGGGGLALLAFAVYGFVSPSRFGPRSGVVLSPEEDLSEGFFHAFRGQKGSRSGFYRAARLYLHEDFRFASRASGAWVRFRADGRHIRLKVVGGTLWRRRADDEWEQVGNEEIRLRPGTCYRNDASSHFFELRRG